MGVPLYQSYAIIVHFTIETWIFGNTHMCRYALIYFYSKVINRIFLDYKIRIQAKDHSAMLIFFIYNIYGDVASIVFENMEFNAH